MGNTPSVGESNAKAERDLNPEKNGLAQSVRDSNAKAERDLNPQTNGVSLAFDPVAQQFDPNNSNGFMGKVKDEGTTYFGKNGKGNQMLRKAGEISNKFGEVYGTAGTVGMGAGLALDAIGLPEFGLPINAVSGALLTAGAMSKKGGTMLNNTADLIEKPKKDRGSDEIEASRLFF
jgi:hypothetical protein